MNELFSIEIRPVTIELLSVLCLVPFLYSVSFHSARWAHQMSRVDICIFATPHMFDHLIWGGELYILSAEEQFLSTTVAESPLLIRCSTCLTAYGCLVF
jgi:hypothetical protein